MAAIHLTPRTEVIPSDVVTPYRQGAVLTIVAAFCTVTSLLFLLARLLIRWPWTKLFAKDDWATTAATVSHPLHMNVRGARRLEGRYTDLDCRRLTTSPGHGSHPSGRNLRSRTARSGYA